MLRIADTYGDWNGECERSNSPLRSRRNSTSHFSNRTGQVIECLNRHTSSTRIKIPEKKRRNRLKREDESRIARRLDDGWKDEVERHCSLGGRTNDFKIEQLDKLVANQSFVAA